VAKERARFTTRTVSPPRKCPSREVGAPDPHSAEKPKFGRCYFARLQASVIARDNELSDPDDRQGPEGVRLRRCPQALQDVQVLLGGQVAHLTAYPKTLRTPTLQAQIYKPGSTDKVSFSGISASNSYHYGWHRIW
jgi:hypothetical protein